MRTVDYARKGMSAKEARRCPVDVMFPLQKASEKHIWYYADTDHLSIISRPEKGDVREIDIPIRGLLSVLRRRNFLGKKRSKAKEAKP